MNERLKELRGYVIPFGHHRLWSLGQMMDTPGKIAELRLTLKWLLKIRVENCRPELSEARERIKEFLARGEVVGLDRTLPRNTKTGTAQTHAQRERQAEYGFQ